MLLGNHGALSLGKTLRRPIMTTVRYSEHQGPSATLTRLATDRMRAMGSKMQGRRVLSNAARSNTTPSTPSPQPQARTWDPNNAIVFSGRWTPKDGIVFRSAAGPSRSLSITAMEKIEQDHLLHSHVEDNYVMAPASTSLLDDCQSCTELKGLGTVSSTLHVAKAKRKAVGVAEATSTNKSTGSEDISFKKSKAVVTLNSEACVSEPKATTAVELKETAVVKAQERSVSESQRSKVCESPEYPNDLDEASAKDFSVLIDFKEPKDYEPEPDDPKYNEPHETTTAYKMDPELFRQAKDAKPSSKESYWSYALYRSPEMVKGRYESPRVHYCKNLQTSEKALKEHFTDAKVIGFDIEWKEKGLRTARDQVSLVQIASESRIALIHVAAFPVKDGVRKDLVPPTLKKIMEDPSIIKVGVAIKGDCTRVKRWLGIESQSLIELSHLHKLVKFSRTKEFASINRTLVSLATQTKEHLHLPMFKGEVRISDWRQPLTIEQVQYAASDSYAGLQLYHTLEMKREMLSPTPPRPHFAELGLAIRFDDGLEIPSKDDAEDVDIDAEGKKEKAKRKYTSKAAAKDVGSFEAKESDKMSEATPAKGDHGKQDGGGVDVSYPVLKND